MRRLPTLPTTKQTLTSNKPSPTYHPPPNPPPTPAPPPRRHETKFGTFYEPWDTSDLLAHARWSLIVDGASNGSADYTLKPSEQRRQELNEYWQLCQYNWPDSPFPSSPGETSDASLRTRQDLDDPNNLRSLLETTYGDSLSLAERAINGMEPPALNIHTAPRTHGDPLSFSVRTLETKLQERFSSLNRTGNSERELTAAILQINASIPDEHHRARRIWNCSQDLYVISQGDEVAIHPNRCHERLCPDCQRHRQLEYRDVIAERLAKMRHPKHWVLTLKHSTDPLGAQISRLIAAFAAVRRRKYWADHVPGGIYVIEFKLSKNDGLWHPHVHLLIDTPYLEHRWVKEAWHKATGDSTNVWVTHADKSTPGELAKYMTKVVPNNLPPGEMWGLYYQIRGRRLYGTFGDQEGLNEPSSGEPIIFLGKLSHIVHRAACGEPQARALLARLAARYVEPPPERPPPGSTSRN